MKIVLLLFILLVSIDTQAGESPASYTYQGKLFRSNGTSPVDGASITLKVQLRSPDGLCLLFEETHWRDMRSSSGLFTISVGEGTNTGVSALSVSQVFDNNSAKTGASGCTYTPITGDTRRLRFSYTDGVETVSMPVDQTIRSVPYAMHSSTLQGLGKDKFIQVSAQTTQTKADALFSVSSDLISIANGTSTLYAKSSDLPFTGGVLNLANTGVKVADAPTANDYAINKNYADSKVAGRAIDLSGLSNGQNLVWNSVSSKWVPATPTSGTVTSITAGTGLAGGTITSSGTVSLATVGTAGTYTKVTTDAYGRVTAAAALSEADLPALTAPGKISAAALATGGTLGQTLSIDSSGDLFWISQTALGTASGDLSGNYPSPVVSKIQGTSVSASAPMSGQVHKYNGTALSPTYLSVFDLKTSLGTAQIPSNCSAAQTLTYNVIQDRFICTNIALSSASITGLGTAAAKNTAASGDASSTELVLGADSRLTDSRAPSGSAGGDLAGSYPNPTLSSTGVSGGTYTKVTVDAKGRVTSATNIAASDVPSLSWTKITSGLPTTLSGYGVTDAITNNGGVPSLQSGLESARPAAATAGRIFVATDTNKIYRDSGSAWSLIASGTVDTGVTANKIVQLDASAKLPAVDGSQLTNLSLQPFSNMQMQVFDASGTWTPPAGVTKVYVQVWGSGAGGGGGSTLLSGGGTGGSGGAYASGVYTLSGTAAVTVTVGAGGAKGNATNAGSNGNSSSFGSHVTAAGGTGGSAGGNTPISGGTAAGILGVVGGHGLPSIGSIGGQGGVSFGGSATPGAYSSTAAGSNASAPGCGGGGGYGTAILATAGGNGAAGRVVVWW